MAHVLSISTLKPSVKPNAALRAGALIVSVPQGHALVRTFHCDQAMRIEGGFAAWSSDSPLTVHFWPEDLIREGYDACELALSAGAWFEKMARAYAGLVTCPALNSAVPLTLHAVCEMGLAWIREVFAHSEWRSLVSHWRRDVECAGQHDIPDEPATVYLVYVAPRDCTRDLHVMLYTDVPSNSMGFMNWTKEDGWQFSGFSPIPRRARRGQEEPFDMMMDFYRENGFTVEAHTSTLHAEALAALVSKLRSGSIDGESA